jgi:hypothetical protein
MSSPLLLHILTKVYAGFFPVFCYFFTHNLLF